MFNPHDYAFQIEVTTKAVFNCDKYELVCISNANFIEKQPFVAMAFVLGNFYNKVDSSFKAEIDEFFQKYCLEIDKSISEIGEKKIKNIIQDFNNIVSTI